MPDSVANLPKMMDCAGKLQKNSFTPHQCPHVDAKPHLWKLWAQQLCCPILPHQLASRRVASCGSPAPAINQAVITTENTAFVSG